MRIGARPERLAALVVFFMLSRSARCLPALDPQETPDSTGRAVSAAEMDRLRNYGRETGQEFLKDQFNLDIEKYARLNLFSSLGNLSIENASAAGSTPSAALGGTSTAEASFWELPKIDLTVDLQPTGNLLRLRQIARDIPFGFKIQSHTRLLQDALDIQTSLMVPLSSQDEFKLDSSMPLPDVEIPLLARLLKKGGLDSPWRAATSYENLLGQEIWAAGLQTHFRGDWDLFYNYQIRNSEGGNEHKIGVGTRF